MPRTCTICRHPQRESIDQALVAGEPFRIVALRFETSATALFRHKAAHLPASLALATQAAEVVRADSLLDQVRALQRRALGLLDKAEAAGAIPATTGALREARATMELVAKLVGELDERTQVNVLNLDPTALADLRRDLVERLARAVPPTAPEPAT